MRCVVDSLGLYANIAHMSHNTVADKHVSETLLVFTPWKMYNIDFSRGVCNLEITCLFWGQ